MKKAFTFYDNISLRIVIKASVWGAILFISLVCVILSIIGIYGSICNIKSPLVASKAVKAVGSLLMVQDEAYLLKKKKKIWIQLNNP